MSVHYEPHFRSRDGYCQCACEDCHLRLTGSCVCPECPCEDYTEDHTAETDGEG